MSPTDAEKKVAEEAQKKADAEAKKKADEILAKGSAKPTYEEWLGKQSDEVKTLLEENVAGLKSALGSERDARGETEKKLRSAAKEAEGAAKEKLEKMADDLKSADEKADFFVAAQTAGVSNLKYAYIVATQEGLFDRRGNVNFEKMKTDFPELFGEKPKVLKGHGGSGQTSPDAKEDMNAFIRRRASGG